MYKPANIRSMVTIATWQKCTQTIVNGRTSDSYSETTATLRGEFKQRESREMTANGLTIIKTDITFKTWWVSGIKAGDLLTINGVKYVVKTEPENVEMRSRYAVLTLERFQGGA